MMNLLFIANARSANGSHMSDTAENLLQQAGHKLRAKPDFHFSTVDEMPEVAGRSLALEWADAIVLVGGDGTLNYYLPFLLQAKKPVLLIAAGTANDFSSVLGLPENVRAACGMLDESKTRTVDVAFANDKPFVNVAHIGLAVEAQRSVNKELKKIIGVLIYVWSAIKAAKIRRMRVDITVFSYGGAGAARESVIGSLKRLKSEQVSVANSGQFGGGWKVSETANPFDGQLELVSVAPSSPWQHLVQLVLCWFNRQTEHEQVTHLQGSGFTVEASRPMDVTGDGEFLTRTPVKFRIERKALSFFVPAQATETVVSMEASIKDAAS